MASHRTIMCKCGRDTVEVDEDWVSDQCIRCNDRDIQRAENRREWDHFHPGEPCPSSELNKVR